MAKCFLLPSSSQWGLTGPDLTRISADAMETPENCNCALWKSDFYFVKKCHGRLWRGSGCLPLLAPALLGFLHFASPVFERIIADQPDFFFFLRFNKTHPAEFLCLSNKCEPACCTRTWPSNTAACWLPFLFFFPCVVTLGHNMGTWAQVPPDCYCSFLDQT